MKSGPVLPQLLVFSILSSVMLALVGCSGSSSYPSPSPTQPSGLGMAVDAVVQSSMQQSGVPGITIAVAKNNTMLYVQGYGVTDVTTHQAMQPRGHLRDWLDHKAVHGGTHYEAAGTGEAPSR